MTLTMITLIFFIVLAVTRPSLLQYVATFVTYSLLIARIFMYTYQRLIIHVLIILVRFIYAADDIDGLPQMTVLYADNPDNGGDSYVNSRIGKLPWTGGREIKISHAMMDSAMEGVSPEYVREYKIKLLNAAYDLYNPQKSDIKLSDVLIYTESSNGDAAIIRAHCEGKGASGVIVLSKAGNPGRFFKGLDDDSE